MAYVFVADDFTGASDTLATLSRAGLRARLFRDLPGPDALQGLDAFGIATDARALGQAEGAALGQRLGRALAQLCGAIGGAAGLVPGARDRPRPSLDLLHLKVCSTFDSSPDIGNFIALALALAAPLGLADLAVIGGQPSLGRHAVFGTLFARAADGRVHRIDRHPVMSIHPVTPMHEADLLRHLARLGLHGLHWVGRGQAGQGFPRFYDALDQADVTAAGRDLFAPQTDPARDLFAPQIDPARDLFAPVAAAPATAPPARLVIGPSSVAEAWLAARPPLARPVPSPIPAAQDPGPVFGFAGSRSSLTTAQIGAAQAIARLPVNPADMLAGGAALDQAEAWALERLARGQDCILYLTADHAGQILPARLARRSAALVARIMARGQAGALLVAGGDTSSAIIQALAPDWLDHAGEICPGVPILRGPIAAGTGGGGGRLLSLALKGGQMGGEDFFARAIALLRGRGDLAAQA